MCVCVCVCDGVVLIHRRQFVPRLYIEISALVLNREENTYLHCHKYEIFVQYLEYFSPARTG